MTRDICHTGRCFIVISLVLAALPAVGDGQTPNAPALAPADSTVMGRAAIVVSEFDPDVVAVYLNHNYWPS